MLKNWIKARPTETYFGLGYGDFNSLIATLGRTPEQIFDPETGQEDFTEHRQVSSYLEAWTPEQVWTPQPICLHFKARGRQCYKTDRIFHNMVGPFISQNAVEKMKHWLTKEGHILPLDVVNSHEKYYLWWLPLVENCFDYAKSSKFPNGTTIKEYALSSRAVKGRSAFRPHDPRSYRPETQSVVLVSGGFRDAWIEAGLTGIDFKPKGGLR